MGKLFRDETGIEIVEELKNIGKALGSSTGSTVYGFHINSKNSDPYGAVTYLRDAVGMTPVHMDYANDTFDWGSWGDAFFLPRPCMLKYDGTFDYYLDENDYTKKSGRYCKRCCKRKLRRQRYDAMGQKRQKDLVQGCSR